MPSETGITTILGGEKTANKNIPGGYAGLDANGLLTASQCVTTAKAQLIIKNLTNASGYTDYNCGFTPHAATLFASSTLANEQCYGITESTNTYVHYNNTNAAGAGIWTVDSYSLVLVQSATINYIGTITFISGGFRMTWTKNGLKTGTAYITILVYQ